METNFFNRMQAMLLAVATVGLVLLAVWNFRQEGAYQQPNDGVWWRDAQGGLLADKVLPDSPGNRAGIQPGDLLTEVDDTPIEHLSDLDRALARTGVFGKAEYSIVRSGVTLDTPTVVYPEPPDRSLPQAQRVIGLIYLLIGFMCSSGGGPRREQRTSISSASSRSLSSRSNTRDSWTGPTGPSSGSTFWPRRCSRRCSCTLH